MSSPARTREAKRFVLGVLRQTLVRDLGRALPRYGKGEVILRCQRTLIFQATVSVGRGSPVSMTVHLSP